MKLEPVTDGVYQLALPPRRFVNAYLVGDVLVDAGLPLHARGILAALAGRTVAAHFATHAHADHVGGSKRICETLGVPVWSSPVDAPAIRAGKPVAVNRFQALTKWAPVTVDRELTEGDEVAEGFIVLDTPGHSPGHTALWRERDRTLICGDVFLNLSLFTTLAGLHEPPGFASVDPAQSRAAARRLAELAPQLVLFGHGEPLRDAPKLQAFTRSQSR